MTEEQATFSFDLPPTTDLPSALDGLADEVVAAITAKVTPEQVRAFIEHLTTEARHADVVRMEMHQYDWFPTHTRPDTQRRYLRVLRDAALLAGYPVCSVNDGYLLGSYEMVLKAAERAEGMAVGALARARVLRAIAARMMETG